MPRQAHGRPVSYTGPARPAKRKPAKGRGLNALEIAEQENPDTYKIRQHRLGESYDDDDNDDTRQDADERSSKRRKTTNDQDGQESDSGSDPDGERWHVGVDEEDEDSDIDSDDAFGESDEDRFADFTFRGSDQNKSRKPRKKKPGPDSDEEFDDPDEVGDIADDFGDDAIDLAAALDMDSGEESEEDVRKGREKKKRSQPQGLEQDDEDGEDEDEDDNSGSDDDSGSEDESEDQSDLFATDEDEDDGDHSRLQTFVEGLSKRKDATDVEQQPAKSTKISAADLLQYVKDPQQRQSLKVIANSEAKGPELYKGGIPGRLAPPLAKRQQDKLDRAAAYDESKKELNKWVDTVKQNRRAEHISFPLPDPSGAPSRNDRFMPVSSSKPMNSLESKIQDIMRESGMLTGSSADKEEQEYEELEEQKLSPEEIQARRAELRRARDLMFREELRSKRIKKIKSKAYRRVHRKERDKAALEKRADFAARGLIDSDDEKEKNDRRRAEERMGARHKESKWARGAKAAGRTVWDEDARVGVSDMARRDDELRRRIEGKPAAASDDSGDDSDAYSSDEADENIRRDLTGVDADSTETGGSKLANMAFMKRAEASKKVANDALVQQIKSHMSKESDDGEYGSGAENNISAGGRQKFGGAAPPTKPAPSAARQHKSEFEERESDDDDGYEEPSALRSATETNGSIQNNHARQTISTKPPKSGATTQVVSKQQFDDSLSQKTASAPSKKAPRPTNQQLVAPPSDNSGSEFGDDADDGEGGGLADAIFGGPDDVAKEFRKEKKKLIEEEGDQVVDNSLAGWGSWGGAGISKKKQKQNKNRFVTKVKGVAPEARKDAKLDKVIINEKRVKKNGKYLATELPHPYESRSQYERAMRLPLGPEWTTKSTFQDATKPRVLVKQGIIKPMARPMV